MFSLTSECVVGDPPPQVKAHGPGLQSSGLAVGKPTEFTVDAKQGGKAPLKIVAQVKLSYT